MPEGDSVFRHAAELRARFVGRRLVALRRAGVDEPRCAGAVLVSADATGKHLELVLRRDDEAPLSVLVHLGIAGQWRVGSATRFAAAVRREAPLLLDFGDEVALVWRPRSVTLAPQALADRRAIAALGPDLLGPAPDYDEIVRRARDPRHAAGPLGELLLDQRVAAGIGNIYKNEACFLEGLHPLLRVDEVDDAKLRRVYARARELMARNLDPGPRATTFDRRGGLRPGRARYWVYGRAGRPCARCGSRIERRASGEALRASFFCPRCQAP
jgi:endonuclease VIII